MERKNRLEKEKGGKGDKSKKIEKKEEKKREVKIEIDSKILNESYKKTL